VTPADADHRCVYREENERLQALLAELQAKLLVVEHELATLQRRVLGPTSEKMTSIQDELRRRGHVPRSPESAKEKRRERAQAKEALERRESFHRVADDKRCCPRCGRDDLKPLGEGRRTTEYHYIPARFIRVDHIQETLACVCGEYVVTAESPPKVVEGGRYGAGFLAHLVTAKCGDSIPIYRLEKEYKRLGIPIARSTMTDLFHRAAELTQPISERLLELIASQDRRGGRDLDPGAGEEEVPPGVHLDLRGGLPHRVPLQCEPQRRDASRGARGDTGHARGRCVYGL
jgi:transposase